MKCTLSLLILISNVFYALSAVPHIIRFPHYEARSSGIVSVDSIEKQNGYIRFYLECRNLPGKGMLMSSKMKLTDVGDTSKYWSVVDMDGADLDRRFQFPDSGKVYLTVDFPALPEGVGVVNLVDENLETPFRIIGISLSGDTGSVRKQDDFSAWLRKSVSSSKDEDIYRSSFLKGWIKGYHPALQWNEGEIYFDNVITKQDTVIKVPISPDGRFEVELPLCYPVQQTIFFPSGYVHFYLEPGRTVGVSVPLEELIIPVGDIADIDLLMTGVEYYGSLAEKNRGLKILRKYCTENTREYLRNMQNMTSIEYRERQDSLLYRRKAVIDSLRPNAPLKKLMEMNIRFDWARSLLDYELYYRNEHPLDTLPVSWYGFLHQLPLDDPLSLSAAGYKIFINRLEYIPPLLKSRVLNGGEILEGFSRMNINLTPQEKELVVFSAMVRSRSDIAGFPRYYERLKDFNAKYAQEQIEISEDIRIRKMYDIYTGVLGLEPSLAFELLFTRQFVPRLRYLKRKLTPREYDSYTRYINSPLLSEMMDGLNR
ncbi:hypothetical protein [Coprobacter tertius]|uniref:Uncharacterized protein n=1 Tax=Coprobacter tertius TaxID=2944915 RepID=A0ABT1MGA2_9BACT|nr:hypothetical protein [Coprobacter tertius]MCP9610886.1 hypothetical protein [Coprobacter tertius]